MRVRILVVAVLAALAVAPAAAARSVNAKHAHRASILGTWSVQVTPDGAPAFPALVTFTKGGGLIETESDAPGTAQGAWERIGAHRYAFAFQAFIFDASGPAGHVVVRGRLKLSHGRLSGPFKFDVYDPTGKVVQSGSGTAAATRFVIPPF
jgi:hypothetical protein